jgi:hypothetical protein
VSLHAVGDVRFDICDAAERARGPPASIDTPQSENAVLEIPGRFEDDERP